MQDFEKQGNGEKEIPIDFGDRVPKQRNRVTLLSRIKTDDGCVGIIFEEILLNDKQTGNDVVNSDPSETT